MSDLHDTSAEIYAACAFEMSKLQARVVALETALAPFGRQDVEKLFEGVADEEAGRHLVEVEVNLADLRRARSVLSEKPQESSEALPATRVAPTSE